MSRITVVNALRGLLDRLFFEDDNLYAQRDITNRRIPFDFEDRQKIARFCVNEFGFEVVKFDLSPGKERCIVSCEKLTTAAVQRLTAMIQTMLDDDLLFH